MPFTNTSIIHPIGATITFGLTPSPTGTSVTATFVPQAVGIALSPTKKCNSANYVVSLIVELVSDCFAISNPQSAALNKEMVTYY